jgi:phosphate transport system permease protein
MSLRQVRERCVETAIYVCGFLSILFVALIFIFLLKESISLFKTVTLGDFLFGDTWYPIWDPGDFGALPLILGSLLVTLGATVISVPLGVGCAFFIAEVAPQRLKDILKTGVEMLAAIPSVVIGFIGMITLVPLIKSLFHIPTGLTALSGSVMLAFMAMPTIVSIAEDAINVVPRSFKEAAIALGATRWQTMYRVTFRAAMPGIVAAIMLGVGRVIGETMAVMMVTGNAAVIPQSILQPVTTLTATIAAEMGETVQGSEHYYALFAIGMVLFIITFAVNLIADLYLHKTKR